MFCRERCGVDDVADRRVWLREPARDAVCTRNVCAGPPGAPDGVHRGDKGGGAGKVVPDRVLSQPGDDSSAVTRDVFLMDVKPRLRIGKSE